MRLINDGLVFYVIKWNCDVNLISVIVCSGWYKAIGESGMMFWIFWKVTWIETWNLFGFQLLLFYFIFGCGNGIMDGSNVGFIDDFCGHESW